MVDNRGVHERPGRRATSYRRSHGVPLVDRKTCSHRTGSKAGVCSLLDRCTLVHNLFQISFLSLFFFFYTEGGNSWVAPLASLAAKSVRRVRGKTMATDLDRLVRYRRTVLFIC